MKRSKKADLVEKGTAAFDKAVTTVTPYVEQAQDRATEAIDALSPHLATAKASAIVARDKVGELFHDEVLPQLNSFAESPADNPTTKEARRRSRAAIAALRGDWDIKEKQLDKLARAHAKKTEKQLAKMSSDFKKAVDKKKAPQKKGHPVRNFLLITGILGAIGMIVKQLLSAKKEDPWQSYEPSSYTPQPTTPAPATPETAETAAFTEAPAATEDVATEEATTAEAVDGTYIGTEPPAGYTIKGNKRSMKYHVEGSDAYDRTIAEVWFNSEEAAEAAGYTKAQR